MKNIFGYPIGTGFTQQEIEEWIREHENCSDPQKARIAKFLSALERYKMMDYTGSVKGPVNLPGVEKSIYFLPRIRRTPHK